MPDDGSVLHEASEGHTHLDQQFEVAAVVVTARGCVASHDFLAVDVGRD